MRHLNRNPKHGQKACLMHALIPEFLGFNAASQYKRLRYVNLEQMFVLSNHRVLFTGNHSHKLFLTFMSVLGKSGSEITNLPFTFRFDNVFLSKMAIKVSFFKNNF